VANRGVLRAGDFILDQLRHEVRVKNQPVNLTSIEFRLVSLLMEHCGVVLDRNQLLEGVWGYKPGASTRTVDTHVMRLRAKLGQAGAAIETVHGVGYRLKEDDAVPVALLDEKASKEQDCLAAA
jgi:DNA-binding response OmpR family regulator